MGRWEHLLLITAIGLSIYNIGGKSRDNNELNDIYLIGDVVPKNTIISIYGI